MIIFPDLPDVEVEGIEVAEEITLTLRTVSPTALCPSCGSTSSRIQSRYTRTLRDLPSVGRSIRLVMQVRRFFCKRAPVLKKSSSNGFQNSAMLTLSAPGDCKKRSAS